MSSQIDLFAAVPAGAIETLFDEHSQPWFKRADLGRFLVIPDIATTYRNVRTFSRKNLAGGIVFKTTLNKGQNWHDTFVTLDGALEISARSRKTKAVELIKWLAKKGVEKLQDEVSNHQKALEEKDAVLAILNDDLDMKRQDNHLKSQEIEDKNRQIDDLIQTRHVPRSGKIDTVLIVIEKNKPDEQGKAGQHPYYMIRCKKMHIPRQKGIQRLKYPDMIVKEPECDDGNAIHCWNRFKEDFLTKDNYYRNHFSLPEDSKDLFEDLFNIEMGII